MRKTFVLIMLSSLIVVSGCSAKEDASNSQSAVEKTGEVKKSNENSERSDAIKAPDFKLAMLDGSEFYLSDFSGKVVMLNFWGTWCPPCRKEIPDLVNLQKKYNKDGLEIVGITLTSGSAADIQKFVDEKKINYTVLTNIKDGETEQVTFLYGQAIGQQISSIPTTLIIDREGYIVKGYLGPRSEEVFYNDLKEFL